MNTPGFEIDRGILESVVGRALGRPAGIDGEYKKAQLSGGSVAAIYRISGRARQDGNAVPWSVILKILHRWEREGDPDSWRREALLYRTTVYEKLPAGLCVPECHEIQEINGQYWLWLEDVQGRLGKQLDPSELGLASRLLGRFQGGYLVKGDLPQDDWLAPLHWRESITVGYRAYSVERLDRNELKDCASHIKIARMRDRLLDLFQKQDQFHRKVNDLPRTLAHRDFHPDNLFARTDPAGGNEMVLLDWDCAGIGVVGEDIGDMIAEILVYFDGKADDGPKLYEALVPEYLAGLREAGWNGEPDLVRAGILANWGVHWCFRLASYVIYNPQLDDCDRLADVIEWLLDESLGDSDSGTTT